MMPSIIMRRQKSQAQMNAIKTHCIRGHEFTPENTISFKNPYHGGLMRNCRECRRLRRLRKKDST